MDAIQAFNGFNWNSYQLKVKFADQDAGPPLSGAFHTLVAVKYSQNGDCSHFPAAADCCQCDTGSGATPSDNLYVRVSLSAMYLRSAEQPQVL